MRIANWTVDIRERCGRDGSALVSSARTRTSVRNFSLYRVTLFAGESSDLLRRSALIFIYGCAFRNFRRKFLNEAQVGLAVNARHPNFVLLTHYVPSELRSFALFCGGHKIGSLVGMPAINTYRLDNLKMVKLLWPRCPTFSYGCSALRALDRMWTDILSSMAER